MAILASTGIYGFLSSMKKKAGEYIDTFVTGFNGHGWRIWEYGVDPEHPSEGLYKLEIDSLTVRRTMTVFELLIQKIRAVKGALAITQGSGKIETVTDRGTYYEVTVEDEMSFVTDDYVRCQAFTGTGVHGYHVKVEVDGQVIKMPKVEFGVNSQAPKVGDEIVQFGNYSKPERQSAIYLHADENGQPAIDVMFGITSKVWDNCVKVRIGGGLPGEKDTQNGFYCENGTIKSVSPDGTTIYKLSPDGSFNLGKGKIKYDPVTDTLTFGEEVTLTWDNLSEDARENLKGESGTSPYTIDLSNENASVAYSYSGAQVGDIPSTTATVYHGSSIDKTWEFSVKRNGNRGATGVVDGVLTISFWLLEEDTSTVEITATKEGFPDLKATYTVTKVYAGAPGEDAVIYSLEPSVNVIKKGKDGTLIPATISCTKMKTVGNKPAEEAGEKTLRYKLSTGSETNYSKAVEIGNTTTWIDFILYDGATVLDRERVPVVEDGSDGIDGINGANGVAGKDGASIVFKGSYSVAPSNPQNGWSYYNTTTKKSYVYQDGVWYQMTIDGVNGANGKDGNDGLSVIWKGDLSTPPSNPEKNWCYRDTDNGVVYIYNGSSWAMMVADGSDGENGANGVNGLSVFITYHDDEKTPSTPTGNGTTNGWHTNPTSSVVWMSQKVAESSNTGTWGPPIKIKGSDGKDGKDANLLEWVADWDGEATEIDGKMVVSPRIFSGKREAESGKLTGVAIGRIDFVEGDNERIGIYGYKDEVETFALDARTGSLTVRGSVAELFHRMNYTQYVERLSGSGENTVYLDFETGFNWALCNESAAEDMILHLPSHEMYNGTRCNVVNIGTGDTGNLGRGIDIYAELLVNRTLKMENYANDLPLNVIGLRLPLNGVAQFYAVPNPRNPGYVNWILMNAQDFKVIRISDGGRNIYLESGADLVLPVGLI